MRTPFALLTAAALVAATPQRGDWHGTPRPPVSSEALQALISVDELVKGAAQLQAFADDHGGTRVMGGPGNNATVNWLYDLLSSTGYYDVSLQEFVALYSGGSASFTADGEATPVELMTYTPNGEGSGPLVSVNNLGCEPTDYPPEVEGAIALVSRGECTFSIKASNAFTAGAIGCVIYNNVPSESFVGTLGDPDIDYPPTVGMNQENGEALRALLEAGPVDATIFTNVIEENRTTYNVLAETRQGDHDNVLVLGGHTDSVQKGPGINDDGSGIIGTLNVALALTKFSVTNAVRFGFWSAEEFGLLGSNAYLESVNQSSTDLAKIKAYLNFDMIASPNAAYFIYDGDGSDFNLTGPPGSAEIEAAFQQYYTSVGENYASTAFNGRSDYSAFIENGIPSGGLFTGAEGIKTAEEVEMFGGEADVAYDACYHEACDTIDNLNLDAFLLNTKSIANSVALYATSFDSFPAPEPGKVRRDPHASTGWVKREPAQVGCCRAKHAI